MRRSTNYGVSFEDTYQDATVVTTLRSGRELWLSGTIPGGTESLGFRTHIYSQAVANPTNPDQLFLVYADGSAANSSDKADIFLSVSNNGGVDWSTTPIRVNDDDTLTDQWQPTIAIKPDGSQLFIGWYDRRNDPTANNFIDTYGVVGDVTSSGVTLHPNFRITTDSFAPYFEVDPAMGFGYMGDYDQAAADDTGFYYSWGDNRDADPTSPNNQGPNVRLARIPSLSGDAATAETFTVRRDPLDSSRIQVLLDSAVVFSAPYVHTPRIILSLGPGDTVAVDAAGGVIDTEVLVHADAAGNDLSVQADSGGLSVPTIELAEGTLSLAAAAAVQLGDLFVGRGTTFAFPASVEVTTATLTVAGKLSFRLTAGPVTAVTPSALHLRSGASLEAAFAAGYTPPSGGVLYRLLAPPATGAWASVTLPSMSGSWLWNSALLNSFGWLAIVLPGDVNNDGLINSSDINAFTYALSSTPEAFAAAYPGGFYWNADCNLDGWVNAADINPFIAILSG